MSPEQKSRDPLRRLGRAVVGMVVAGGTLYALSFGFFWYNCPGRYINIGDGYSCYIGWSDQQIAERRLQN